MPKPDETPAVDVDSRTKQALVQKAEADAVAAQHAAQKAEADTRAADAAARKAETEADDLESPTGAQARDAKNRQSIAEAEQKEAAARQQALSALIPDFSKVKDSSLEVSTQGPAIGGAALTFGALADVAKAIAAQIMPPAEDNAWRVLVTSDPDLASADASYQEVALGLAQLATAADELLPEATVDSVETAGLVPVLAAVAAAVPSVLSLLSAERSVATAPVTISDLAAATAVAGALKAQTGDRVVVVHDDFRLVVPGRIQTASTLVATKRHELVATKLALADRKGAIDAELAIAKADEKDAEKAVADADPKIPHPDLDTDLDNARKRVTGLTRKSGAAAVRLGLVDGLIASIDAFTAAIRVIPAGGRRSPFATAALYDELHAGASSQFTHALLVKAQPAQSAQLTDDKPLWFRDKFSTIVEVNVTYMLIATGDSRIVRAGTATAIASAHGDLGSELRFDTTAPVVGVWNGDGDPDDGDATPSGSFAS
jgi:hypothetical protein